MPHLVKEVTKVKEVATKASSLPSLLLHTQASQALHLQMRWNSANKTSPPLTGCQGGGPTDCLSQCQSSRRGSPTVDKSKRNLEPRCLLSQPGCPLRRHHLLHLPGHPLPGVRPGTDRGLPRLLLALCLHLAPPGNRCDATQTRTSSRLSARHC